MPPAVGIVVAVAAGAAAAATVITATTALMIASVAMAASAMLNKPKVPGSGTSPSDRKQVIRSAASTMTGVVGTSQIAGVLTFIEEIKSSDDINMVVALAGHTKPAGDPVIKAVNKVTMDDEEIPLGESHGGKVFVRVYDGSQTSINDLGSDLTSLSSWRSDMIGKGICFAHIRCRYDQKLFPNGLPNFVFELDTLGKDEQDNQKVSLSSDAILEYLRNNFGATDDEIDFDSFNSARPLCAETVSNGDGGTEPRYTCNGAFNYDESHKQIIDKMMMTCAGQLTYINGQFGIRVGAYNGPADFILTEDDIIGDVSVKPMPDRRSLINTCKGKHVWPDAKYQEVDFPKVYSEEMLDDDGEELEKDLNLEFCHSPYQCQRLAANDISRARLPVITVPCNMRAFECHLGRNIKLHMPTIGFDHKECVVESWELNPEKGVTLTLREDNPKVWTDIVGKVPVLPPNLTLPNPKDCLTVDNITLEERAVDGVWEARISWEHPHPASIYKYKVLLEKNTGSEWVIKENSQAYEQQYILNNPASAEYRITLAAINRFDVDSDPVSQVLGVNVPELTITALAASIDNSVYPATGVIVAEVNGADSFPAESIAYEAETKTGDSQWLSAGKGTAPSCRLTGLNAGVHFVRMRAVPPYGEPSEWNQAQFEVFAVDQPTELAFTPDTSLNYWGSIGWTGAGQSWEVEVRQNSLVIWKTTTTERLLFLSWQTPGSYQVDVRSKAGALVSEWASLAIEVDDLLPPENMTFIPDDTSATGGCIKWQSPDSRMEMCEMELSDSHGEVLHTAVTGSPQAIIPVLAPGNYTAKVRCRWRDQLSDWEVLTLSITDNVAAPTDLLFNATNESAWLGNLTWNNNGLPSELQIIDQDTAAPVVNILLLSGYYHVPLLGVGNYSAEVRTVGTYSQSKWVSTTITVGKPEAPSNLDYRETADNPASAGQIYWTDSISNGVSGYDVAIIDSNNQSVLATRVQSNWLDIGNIANGQFIAKVRAVSLLAAETSELVETSFTVSALAAPVNLNAEEKLVETGTGFTSQVTVRWQSNDARTQSYDVEYRLASSAAWSGLYSGPSNTASRNGLTSGDYRFRVRAKNGSMESGWADKSLTVRGIETAPDDITGLHLSGITGQMAQLSWDTITSIDVINGGSIHVRHTPFTGPGATWATAVPITERLPGNTTLVTVPLLTGTYLVKAVNPAEYWSVNAAGVASNMASLNGYNRLVNRSEPNHWPGEKNKAAVDGGNSLTLSESNENNDPPFYVMHEPLDLGAVFTVRLHLECDGTVYERDTIDEREDNIDEWEMFDGALAGGTSLQYQVATTNDDPAIGDAVWSGWTQFFVGEFRARAFKLRVVLINPTPSAAGTLASLKLIADVPDRTETANGLTAPDSGLLVNYQTPFLASAMVAVTAHGMTTGDYYRITSQSASGFTIRFYNKAGASVSRSFDYAAVSYGEG